MSPGSTAGMLMLALFQRGSPSSSLWGSGALVEIPTSLESSVLLRQGFHAASFSACTCQPECHCQKGLCQAVARERKRCAVLLELHHVVKGKSSSNVTTGAPGILKI